MPVSTRNDRLWTSDDNEKQPRNREHDQGVGQYGWTNDFVLNAQTPVSGNHAAAIVTGSVTDTTETALANTLRSCSEAIS